MGSTTAKSWYTSDNMKKLSLRYCRVTAYKYTLLTLYLVQTFQLTRGYIKLLQPEILAICWKLDFKELRGKEDCASRNMLGLKLQAK
jgi:hypothetical protein